MKKPQLLLTALTVLTATLIFSQTLPSTLPQSLPKYMGGSGVISPEAWVFHLGGKEYRARITQGDVDAGPDWSPSKPLPLSLIRAEEIARVELRKLGTDDSAWELTDLHLKRLRRDYRSKWFYVVGLGPGPGSTNAPNDSYYAAINLSGKAAVAE